MCVRAKQRRRWVDEWGEGGMMNVPGPATRRRRRRSTLWMQHSRRGQERTGKEEVRFFVSLPADSEKKNVRI